MLPYMNKLKKEAIEKSKSFSRNHFKGIRDGISDESKNLLDTALCLNAADLVDFKNAECLLCYYPVRGEPDILPLVKHAWELQKKVAFPISHVASKEISFHIVNDLSELSRGAYRIPEPNEGLPKITDFSNSICIIPGLAFDSHGHRLGYGGGFYDRFLSKYNGVSVMLAYSALFAEDLPTDENDQAVDIIITEKGEFFSSEKRKG